MSLGRFFLFSFAQNFNRNTKLKIMIKRLFEKLKALRLYFVSSSCYHQWYRAGMRFGIDVHKCSKCSKFKNNYC